MILVPYMICGVNKMELTKDEVLNILGDMKERAAFPEEKSALTFAIAMIQSSTFGYWEHLFGDRYECPTCGNYVNYHIDEDDDSDLSLADDWKFCPSCGTRMFGIIECVSDDQYMEGSEDDGEIQ